MPGRRQPRGLTPSHLAPPALLIFSHQLDPSLINKVHIYSSPIRDTYDASFTTYKKALGREWGLGPVLPCQQPAGKEAGCTAADSCSCW